MSVPAGIVDAQLESLLLLLERERALRCEREISQARERAAEMMRQARAEARWRIAEAVRYERARMADRLQREDARVDTERRRSRQAALREIVGEVWDLLPRTLEERWRDAAAREGWCRAALSSAATLLRGAPWTMQIAPGPGSAEQDRILALARQLREGAHSLVVGDELRAGLRISAPGAELDASLAGLCVERARIEAYIAACWLDSGNGDGAAERS